MGLPARHDLARRASMRTSTFDEPLHLSMEERLLPTISASTNDQSIPHISRSTHQRESYVVWSDTQGLMLIERPHKYESFPPPTNSGFPKLGVQLFKNVTVGAMKSCKKLLKKPVTSAKRILKRTWRSLRTKDKHEDHQTSKGKAREYQSQLDGTELEDRMLSHRAVKDLRHRETTTDYSRRARYEVMAEQEYVS